MKEILIKNVTILTMDDENSRFFGWVLLKNGKIDALGEGEPPACSEVLDGEGGVLTPGLIDIHCPEFWGFVFFTEHGEPCPVPEDERRKLTLRRLYYAQHAYRAAHGCFCADMAALLAALPPHLAEKPEVDVQAFVTPHGFELSCPAADGPGLVCLRQDGYTWLTREED